MIYWFKYQINENRYGNLIAKYFKSVVTIYLFFRRYEYLSYDKLTRKTVLYKIIYWPRAFNYHANVITCNLYRFVYLSLYNILKAKLVGERLFFLLHGSQCSYYFYYGKAANKYRRRKMAYTTVTRLIGQWCLCEWVTLRRGEF